MHLLHIHHGAIICSNYKVSKHFYVDLLGMEMIQETYREERQSYKLDLQIGAGTGGQIELFSFPDSPKRLSRPEACGLRHLAFAVQSVKVTAEELKSKGIDVEPIRIDPITEKLFTFFKDPDDLPLELYEK
ncbi:VOC family protein [Terrilactibacillus sp. S3-3]|nr:VOC family protein [Terrilactibacillus sp. S3-3]